MKVVIIILHYNSEEDTRECLRSLEKIDSKGLEIEVIVVDNGSRENFKFPISNFQFQIKILRNDENLGFAEGNNIGIRKALEDRAEYIVLLNNDTVVHKEFIQELIKVAQSDKKIGIVAPKIYFSKGFEFHKNRYKEREQGKVIWYAGGIMDWNNAIGHHRGVDEVDHGQYEKLELTQFASGCCLLVKREVFEKVGIFDPRYFLYYEESDLCERVKRRSYTIMFAPEALVWHKNAQASGGAGSELQDYYITRNRMLFGNTYAPFRTKLALLRESLKILKNGRKWQKKGIRDYYMKKFGRGSYKMKNEG